MYNGGRAPRGNYAAGVIQDDHGAISVELAEFLASGERVPAPMPPSDCVAAARFALMDQVYQMYGLKKNAPKELRRAFEGILWGVPFNGISGVIRAPVPRMVALSVSTVMVVYLQLALLNCLRY